MEDKPMNRKKELAEFRRLIEAAGLNQRTIEYWLSGQQDVPRMAILAMRWIAKHGVEAE